MGKSAQLLFKELSNPEFIETCLNTLDEGEKEDKEAIMATLIVHVNQHAHERTNEDGVYGDLNYLAISDVAKSLYVGIKHGYSVPPPERV